MKTLRILAALSLALLVHAAPPAYAKDVANVASTAAVEYRTVKVDGVNVFYREAGPKNAPVLLLLHGFPTSSQMFRNLIPQLADRYRLIAPDYPGYGQSDMPPMDKFTYSFDNLANVIDKFTQTLGLTRYALYVQDYGAPIGFRVATAHPERVTAIVVQNGNAYDEGIAHSFWDDPRVYWKDKTEANGNKLRPLFELAGTKWQYTEGARDPAHVSPDAWTVDQAYMDRPGNKDIQLEMFYSYGTNPPHYPAWQAYFRKHQPPMLIVWGKNDKIFPPAGAHPYLRDLPKAELHFVNTGHFALEEDSVAIANYIRPFLAKNVKAAK
ncbi:MULTISPECIES: alpha/beta fold hydrolase [unclassified Duganella]|uniref:alpha/beta fold hydrolase n=1 Tax=unclassified Duganella TaxID=2636909 RepID=UPI00088CE417|nr:MULTISPECIES: alpha/beta hydrolase [unclassified Duganella]SDF57514.1 Pimeloyl-ACP methyl ester carboxylesterase [Duganella sp. OV458]SDI70927.1 Pimeloyl-ACP methyl ester carboxylesterase [Duganella sp. OV510]